MARVLQGHSLKPDLPLTPKQRLLEGPLQGQLETGEGTALTAVARTPQTPQHRPPGAGFRLCPSIWLPRTGNSSCIRSPCGRAGARSAVRIMEGFRVERSGTGPWARETPQNWVWGRGVGGNGGHPGSPCFNLPI